MRRWRNGLFWVVHILAAPVSIAGMLAVVLLAFAISLGVN
jgi:hypothetical protein